MIERKHKDDRTPEMMAKLAAFWLPHDDLYEPIQYTAGGRYRMHVYNTDLGELPVSLLKAWQRRGWVLEVREPKIAEKPLVGRLMPHLVGKLSLTDEGMRVVLAFE